jgi:enoyl-CoA hydratase
MGIIEQQIDNDGILTLTLNRPEKLNALSQDVLQALHEILSDAKDNKAVKAVLITGTGKAFCAGADIGRLAQCNAETGYQFACDGQATFQLLATLGKPSLAAVNGYAFGGGCELAIAATFRLAASNAQFGQPEVKLGVIPGYGGTQRLARLIGKGRALDLCLTGRFIDAPTALQWGLVSEVLAPEALLERSKAWLRGVLSMAPQAIASVMEVIEYGYDLTLDAALHLEAIHFAKVCASHDKKEGVEAFLAKRQAVFTGE